MSPRHTRVPEDACPAIRDVLTLVGDKWSVLIIGFLSDGTRRFNEIRRGIDGISQRMLTLKLRGLERHGLVERIVFPTVPPRVDYRLTPLGETLLEPMLGLITWATTHRHELRRGA
ncbi:MAG: winged helix-turn-helix transcriptional regulator [Vicinamibacterales bacterium]